MKIYAVYKGEEVLAVGTIAEIANKLRITVGTVKYYGTNSYKKKIKTKNARMLVSLGEDKKIQDKNINKVLSEREKCFADLGVGNCTVLREKICYECNFYKPISSQIKVVVKDIRKYEGLLSRQSLKTLVGQAKAGDVHGALTGLTRIKNMTSL